MFDLDAILERASALADVYVIVAAQAILLLVVGWIAARWIGWAVRRALTGRRHIDQTLVGFFAGMVRYGVLAFVVIAVLARLGIHTTSLVAVLGAAGLAIGFALRDTLAHVAAGVLLLIIRPFNAGDFVDAGGLSGTVDEIGLFSTVMRTPDNVRLIVPNGQLWSSAIRNFNTLPTRRLDVTIGVGYGGRIGDAIETARQIVAGDARVLADPESIFVINGLADSAVLLLARCWCRREDYWQLQWDLTRALKEAFDANGIEIPFPQRVVHMARAG